MKKNLKCHEKLFVFAGIMVLFSVALNLLFSPWWLAFTAFIGVNMIQAQFTGFCPAEIIMRKTGICREETRT